MKLSVGTLTVLAGSLSSSATGCRFAELGDHGDARPHDHAEHHIRRRRLQSLHDDDSAKARLAKIIDNRVMENQQRRSLQSSDCLSVRTYQELDADIEAFASNITNSVDRSHFLGGIVRLAAHDFMDFDQGSTSDPLGPDGCIDFARPANAGLTDLWCPDCFLTKLHSEAYPGMSRADFWIASANAVIRQTSVASTSPEPLDLQSTFRWGRVDNDGGCVENDLSSSRLPKDDHCREVEAVFIDRMGLSWRDATALLGAHTLGRGDAAFSGHDGIWVDTVQESLVFDKRYYEEIRRRAWIPRNLGSPDLPQDWTWGGGNQGNARFMLNTDMCLDFDVDDIFDSPDFPEGCCSDINGNCRNAALQNVPCPTYTDTGRHPERLDAVQAITDFIGADPNRPNDLNNGNQAPFFAGFAEAWEKATQVGREAQLQPLSDTCGPTIAPTQSPTPSPTTPSPIPPTPLPTPGPTPVSTPPTPTAACQDLQGQFLDSKGRLQDCTWVVSNTRNKCKDFAHLCPATCDECNCLLKERLCNESSECCSGECRGDGRCGCLSKGSPCDDGNGCCSGLCINNECAKTYM